jgi:hypothetical protein
MRPTGVVLIAIYHFLSAVFLALLAISLVVGGSVLALMFGGAGRESAVAGLGLGLLVGVFGAAFFLFYAAIAAVAGYGIWALREWGRIMSIVLAVLSLLFSLPGLLMMGLHLNLFFGTYRLVRIAISILIIWYLLQPQIKALFQRRMPLAPGA